MEAAKPSPILATIRPAAHTLAYLVATLLATMWISSATASLSRPVLDLGKPRIGEAILSAARMLDLTPHGILEFALLLVGLKLLLGSCLLLAVLVATYQRLRFGRASHAMLDVALFVSALASIVAAAPLAIEGEGLRTLVGELMLCVIANALASVAPSVEDERQPALGLPGAYRRGDQPFNALH